MTTTLTTRQTAGTGATVKGAPLTNAEVDANFLNLNAAVQPAGGTAGQVLSKIDGTDFNSQWIDNYSTALKFQAKNTTGGTLNKGTVVYVSGAAGANPYISAAQANAELTSATTVGILESTVANNGFGLVVRYGVISGIDTSAALEGDPVWLSPSTAGGMVYGVANKPQAPNHIVYLGTVTRSHAVNGEIQFQVSNGWELDELHDVQITSKANNDIIQYNSASGVWKNVAPASARSNLGLAIGTDVQAYDADLAAIAALSGTAGFLKTNGAGTWSVDTTTYLSGTVAVANGGSGATTAQGAMNTFAGAVTSGSYLRGNGTNVVMSAIQAADVPTLNQNTTGSAATFTSTTQNSQFNSVGVGTAGSGTAGEIRATNNITAYYSDIRLKTKIGDIVDPLGQIRQIETMIYHANETAVALGYDASVIEVGLNAQSVQKVQPYVVAPAPIDDKYLTVRYERLVPLLIESVKALDAIVAKLVD